MCAKEHQQYIAKTPKFHLRRPYYLAPTHFVVRQCQSCRPSHEYLTILSVCAFIWRRAQSRATVIHYKQARWPARLRLFEEPWGQFIAVLDSALTFRRRLTCRSLGENSTPSRHSNRLAARRSSSVSSSEYPSMVFEEVLALGKRLLQKSIEADLDHEGRREKLLAKLSGKHALPVSHCKHDDPIVVDDVHVSMDLDPQGNILTCKIEKLGDATSSSPPPKSVNTFPRSRHESTSRFSLIEVFSTGAADRPVNVGANSRTGPFGGAKERKTLPFLGTCQRYSSAPILPTMPSNHRTIDSRSMESTHSQVIPVRILLAKDFKQIKLLGHGSGGVVVLVEDTVSGETLVMKAIEKKSFEGDDRVAIYAEQYMLKKLSGNPSFTELRGSFEDTRYFYLLMDYAPRGDLTSYLMKKCDVVLARSLMAELVVALESLHVLRIIHRDVKPANILVDNDYHIVIADFGLARDFGYPLHKLPWSAGPRDIPSRRPLGDRTEGWFGTTGYVAPEIYCDRHSYEVDIWSAGVILYRLLSGELPFGIEPLQETIEVMQRTVMLPLDLCRIDDTDARNLLRMMLQKDPSKRATWPQIKAHPFFKSIEWERLSLREKSQRVPKARRRSQPMRRSPIIVQYGEPCKPGMEEAPWFYWMSPFLEPSTSAVSLPSTLKDVQCQAQPPSPSSLCRGGRLSTLVKLESKRPHAWAQQLADWLGSSR